MFGFETMLREKLKILKSVKVECESCTRLIPKDILYKKCAYCYIDIAKANNEKRILAGSNGTKRSKVFDKVRRNTSGRSK